jgi:hypothetical protein
VAKSDKNVRHVVQGQESGQSGKKWQKVAKSGKKWQKVAKSGKKWQKVAKSDGDWAQIGRSTGTGLGSESPQGLDSDETIKVFTWYKDAARVIQQYKTECKKTDVVTCRVRARVS